MTSVFYAWMVQRECRREANAEQEGAGVTARAEMSWRGDLMVGAGWARFVGRAGPAPASACASLRIAVAMCSWIAVSEVGTQPRRVSGAIAAPEIDLVVDPVRLYSQVLFLDARLTDVHRLGAHRSHPLDGIGRERTGSWRRAIYGLAKDDDLARVVQALLPAQAGGAKAPWPNPDRERVEALREWDNAAYVVAACRGGATLTSAMRASGFGSARQCQAAFLRLFGLAPSALLGFSDAAGRTPT